MSVWACVSKITAHFPFKFLQKVGLQNISQLNLILNATNKEISFVLLITLQLLHTLTQIQTLDKEFIILKNHVNTLKDLWRRGSAILDCLVIGKSITEAAAWVSAGEEARCEGPGLVQSHMIHGVWPVGCTASISENNSGEG